MMYMKRKCICNEFCLVRETMVGRCCRKQCSPACFAALIQCAESSYQYRLLFFLFHHYYLCNDLQNGPNLLSCYNVKRVSGYTLHKIIKISITYQYKNSLAEFNLTTLILKTKCY